MKKYFFLLLFSSFNAIAQSPITDKQFFIENKGQWDKEVVFLAQLPGLNAWVTNDELVCEFYKSESNEKSYESENILDADLNKPRKKTGHVVKLKLLGANQQVNAIGGLKNEAYYNYFIGNDKSTWASNVGLYKEAILKDVYPGIDMRYYIDEKQLRYDYILEPNADASKIKMKLEGTENIAINENGELVFSTVLGDVKHTKLQSYQLIDGKKTKVNSAFQLSSEGSIGFWLDSYNKNYPLIIDPVIYYTAVAGIGDEAAIGIALRNQETFITGWTTSSNYPTSPGAFQTIFPPLISGFVSKYSANGSSLMFSTFIGGNFGCSLNAIDVDQATGNAYVTGITASNLTYPTTVATNPPLNQFFQGSQDAVVTVINSTGTGLVYSTYLGGINTDWGNSIKIDPTNANIVYIGGSTHSPNFPVYNNGSSFGPTMGGSFLGTHNGFVTKINITGGITGIMFSRFLRTNVGTDVIKSLALDASSNVYVTSNSGANTASTSTTYPGILFGPSLSPGANSNIVITKLDPNGNILYSTIGGASSTVANNSTTLGIDVNPATNEAYVVGTTYTNTFPVIPSGSSTYYGGSSDIFLIRVNATGTVIKSRFIGGVGSDYGRAIKCFNGTEYITGWSLSVDYPHFPCPNSNIYPPPFFVPTNRDLIFTQIDANLTNYIFSRTIYQPNLENGNALAVDNSGIYVAGFYTDGSNDDHVLNTKISPDFIPNPCINIGNTSLPSTINTNPSPNPNGFRINSNIVITGVNVSFNNMDIVVTGAYSITVNSGATLNISSSHLRACTNQWVGIRVLAGGRLAVDGNTLIEDAAIAIDMVNPVATSSGIPWLIVKNSIFNKNRISININNYNQSSTAIYPFVITGSVFTSRNLIHNCFTYPYWKTVAQLQVETTPSASTNFLLTPFSMASCPFQGLLAGGINTSTRCGTHIRLNNVGFTTLSGTTPTYQELTIGATSSSTAGNVNMNIFEYADFGIDAINSNVAIVNSVFQNIPRIQAQLGDGIAIRANKNFSVAGFATPRYQLRCESVTVPSVGIFKNRFYNCFEGVQSTNYYTTLVNNNEFYSNQSVLNLTTIGTQEINNNTVGRKAIDILSVASHSINITNNRIFNHTVGIWQVSGIGTPVAALGNIQLGYKDFRDNLIQDNVSGNPLGVNTFLGDAIVVNMLNGTGTSASVVTGVTNSFTNYIYHNIIRNAYRGITYSNFNFTTNVPNSGLVSNINANDITLSQDFYTSHNMIGIHTMLNNQLEVRFNLCTGIYTPANAANTNRFTSYQSDMNSKQLVSCNSSAANYTAFKFLGLNTLTTWTLNKMQGGHHYGLSLGASLVGSSLLGIIGTQGTTLSASDNQWLGGAASFTAGQTLVTGTTNANLSRLRVRNNILPADVYSPTLNAGTAGLNYATVGNLVTVNLPTGLQSCIPPQPIAPQLPASVPDPSIVTMLNDVIEGKIKDIADVNENDWIIKQQTYQLLNSEPAYIRSTPALFDFYNKNRPLAMSDIKEVEDLIDAGDYVKAKSVADNMVVNNNIEQNYKQYYNLLLPYITGQPWNDDADGLALLNLANKCIYTDGAIVSNARTLYNTIYRDQYLVFNDDCKQSGKRKTDIRSKTPDEFEIGVYPNPATSGFDLKSNCAANCQVNIMVTNMLGQTVLEKICNMHEGNCFVNTNIANGSYIVTITMTDTKEVFVRKLLVQN